MKKICLCFALVMVCDTSLASNLDQADWFARMKLRLTGAFDVESEDLNSQVLYREIARGSVLVETWYSGSQNEEVTLFHLDNGDLVATHYCAKGVQSTMRVVWPPKSENAIEFKLASATNLASPEATHNSGFAYTFLSETVHRTETWSKQGKLLNSQLTLVKR